MFRCIIFASSKDIRFGTFSIAKFMDLRLRKINFEEVDLAKSEDTIVPYVTSPTSAFAGKRLRLIISESFNAFKLSSSWQVSTT